MNNETKKHAKKLAQLFEKEVGELPHGGFFQFAAMLPYYRPETIEKALVQAAGNEELMTSEAVFSAMRRRLRGDE